MQINLIFGILSALNNKKMIKHMRTTFSILIVTTLQISATVYSQDAKVSIHLENAGIIDVFNEIEKQSEYKIFYKTDNIDKRIQVSVNEDNITINSLLSSILSAHQLSFDLVDKVIVVMPDIVVQGITVTGTVTDENGEPLPGVNVLIQGTTTGVVTGVNGQYSINVPDRNAILVFSFMGFATQEITVEDRTGINIALSEDTREIEEVVVVGFGTQKKVNLTGAVAAVRVDETLASRSLTNVSSGLQGILPGLAVNQNSGMAGKNDVTLMIRGLGTVNNANPLVVVDGMPDVDINRINMGDIESVSVLKDAASSAVYGSRAANGVILITTKSGRGSKTNVNISGSYAISNPTNKYEFMADYPRALTVHQRAAAATTAPSLQNFKNGTIDQWMALGMIDPLRYPNTDWWDIILRQGAIQNYNLSASGSNEKSNFFASIGIMDEKGLQLNNDYIRYNARFNYDYNVGKNMNVGIKFYGNWSKYTYALKDGYTDDTSTNTAGFDLLTAIAGITPYDPVTGYYGGVMAYNENSQAYNPYVMYINNLTRQNRQEANAGIYWDWSPVKGLTAYVDYALSYFNQFRYVANIPNRAYNFQTETFIDRRYATENTPIQNYTNTGYKTQLTGRLNYGITIADRHNINVMAAYSEEYWYDRSQTSSRNDRLHPSLHELNAALQDIQSTAGESSTEGLRSIIGRLNYSAFDKYLLELNFRVDGSSKFLPGSQYGFFPSAAIGWRFTEEEFIKSITDQWLASGKLRVSYGSLGNNSGVSRYQQKETLAASNYILGAGPNAAIVKGFVNSKMVNRDLSWETTTVLNIGLDMGFIDNRLMAELDYYDRLTTGMNRPSDLSIHLTGAYSPAPRRNIGNLRNKGVEANVTWRDKKGNFKYMININASYNRNRLEKWNEFLSKGYEFLDMPWHFLYTYEDEGIAQTWEDVYNATPQGAAPGDILIKDVNGDGRIDSNDRVAYPNIQRNRPTTNYALNVHLARKGIDFAVLFQGAAGRKDFWINNYNDTDFQTQRYASSWNHWNKPWSVENRYGGWPRLGVGNHNRSQTAFWLDNLSYLRLKNVQLGYTLPKRWIEKLRIEKLRIYGSGENIFTLTKFRGLDPEKSRHASDAYPLVRSFSIGVNISI
jgi:TonB-linked SusC/RagA family outer membrane protein